MRNSKVLLPFLLLGVSLRCMPDIESISAQYGQPPDTSTGGSLGGGGSGGRGGRGGGGSGGSSGLGGTAGGGATGGTSGTGGRPSTGGSAGAQGGEDAGGEGGLPAAGDGGEAGAGAAGEAGQGGGGTAGTGGSSAGSTSQGGTSGSAGGGEGGAGGVGEPGPTGCIDGCADLYIPFDAANQTQFFTINLGDVNLEGAVITARVRTYAYTGTTGTIKLYASETPTFDYYGNSNNVALGGLGQETILTMTVISLPTANPAFDATHVGSFGFQIFNDGGPNGTIPIHILVEDIVVEGADIGPWLFTENATALTVNTFQQVPGTTVAWMPPDRAPTRPAPFRSALTTSLAYGSATADL